MWPQLEDPQERILKRESLKKPCLRRGLD